MSRLMSHRDHENLQASSKSTLETMVESQESSQNDQRDSAGANVCDLLLFALDQKLSPSLYNGSAGRQTLSDKGTKIKGSHLSTWCDCKQMDLLQSNEPSSAGENSINHLICSPGSLSDFSYGLLEKLLEIKQTAIDIDYLSISVANLRLKEQLDSKMPAKWNKENPLRVNQLSFSFTLNGTSSVASLYEGAIKQMEAFLKRFVVTRQLQSLTIVCEVTVESDLMQNYARFPSEEMMQADLSELLAPLISLTRLEISINSFIRSYDETVRILDINLNRMGPTLLLNDKKIFKSQNRLKWFSLNSNLRILFQNQESSNVGLFDHMTNLNYLTLESSNIERFPLFNLMTQTFSIKDQHYSGHANLTSLNLAKNRLHRLGEDLLCSHDTNSSCSLEAITDHCPLTSQTIDNTSSMKSNQMLFLSLPSLSQMDLSYNKIYKITSLEAQMILCLMPQLMQLYLQHNQIISLNLNSLLSYSPNQTPLLSASSNGLVSLGEKRSDKSGEMINLDSRLEFIDLSHNRLLYLAAIRDNNYLSNTRVRLKSIKLSHNRLEEPLIPVDASLVGRVVFEETVDNVETNYLNLKNLNRDFQLSLVEANISICDFLSTSKESSEVYLHRHDDEDSQNDLLMLNELILDWNNFRKIALPYFNSARCSQVEILHLRGNKINTIERGSFDRLRSLKHLDLSQNQLTNIEVERESLFGQLTDLRLLNLSTNKLRQLSFRTTFENLTSLEELNLSRNELTSLAKDVFFINNSNLIRLDISHNRLTQLDASIFSHLKMLEQLMVFDNKLKNFNQVDLFKQKGGLVETMMVHSGDKHENKKDQEGKRGKRLKGAEVQEQQIKSSDLKKVSSNRLKQSSKRSARSLQYGVQFDGQGSDGSSSLLLGSNRLTSFELNNSSQCDHLNSMMSIQTLALDKNHLSELDINSFRCFPELRSIHLQSNQLKSIDMMIFEQMISLEYLNLADNYLLRLRSFRIVINQLTLLRHLDLNRNQLVQFDLAALSLNDQRETPFSISYLDLSDNPSLKLESYEIIKFLRSKHTPQISSMKVNRIGSISKSDKLEGANLPDTPKQLETMHFNSIHHEIDPNFFKHLAQVRIRDLHLGLSPRNAIDGRQYPALFDTFLSDKVRDHLTDNIGTKLDLSSNNLTSTRLHKIWNLSTRSEEKYWNIIQLNLSQNELNEWPLTSGGFSRLKLLDLSGNRLRYLLSGDNLEVGFNLPLLENLDLSSNNLIAIQDDSVRQEETISKTVENLARLMPSLRIINLANNKLTWLPSSIFDKFTSLVDISLKRNLLQSFNFPTNQLMRGIKLDLSNNNRLNAFEVNRFPEQTYSDDLVTQAPVPYILYRRNNVLTCNSVDNFINELQGQSREFNEDDDSDEWCPSLIKSLIHINLESVSKEFNLSTILRIGNPFSLNLAKNDGPKILSSLSSDIVSNFTGQLMELSLNSSNLDEFHDDAKFCSAFGLNLVSLDLSENKLQVFPRTLAVDCKSLDFLNLRRNQIERLNLINNLGADLVSNLKVLDLSYNNLKTLDTESLRIFARLQYLDLRFNKFKSSSDIFRKIVLWRPRMQVMVEYEESKISDKIKLIENGNSLSIESPKKVVLRMNRKEDRSIGDQKSTQIIGNWSESHSIKYCALIDEKKDFWNICLNGIDSQPALDSASLQACFELRVPFRGQSCMTDLVGLEANQLSDASVELRFTKAKELRNNNGIEEDLGAGYESNEDTSGGNGIKTDLVISLIDHLKSGWLKLRRFDIGKQLSSISQVQDDSILFTIESSSGKIPIYTLTAMKLAICMASICIILLLVAMFSMLISVTKRVGSRQARQRAKISPANSSNSESNCDDSSSLYETNSSTTNDRAKSRVKNEQASRSRRDNSQTTTLTNCTSSSGRHTDASASTSTTSSSNQSDSNTRTMVAEIRPSSLQGYQLNQQQMLASSNQNYPTPSSSVAASSMETAETMQAMDSIQTFSSAATIQAHNQQNHHQLASSNDQYSPMLSSDLLTPISGLSLVTQQGHLHQLPIATPAQIPVATVLRMVKSSSASAFNNSERDASQGSTLANSNRMQTIYERAAGKCQQVPSYMPKSYSTYKACSQNNSHQYQSVTGSDQHSGPFLQQQMSDLDPATLSLLSINTALSSALSPGGDSHPPPMDGAEAIDVPLDSADVLASQRALNLCHYHQSALNHYSQQPDSQSLFMAQQQLNLDNFTQDNLSPPPPPPEVEY